VEPEEAVRIAEQQVGGRGRPVIWRGKQVGVTGQPKYRPSKPSPSAPTQKASPASPKQVIGIQPVEGVPESEKKLTLYTQDESGRVRVLGTTEPLKRGERLEEIRIKRSPSGEIVSAQAVVSRLARKRALTEGQYQMSKAGTQPYKKILSKTPTAKESQYPKETSYKIAGKLITTQKPSQSSAMIFLPSMHKPSASPFKNFSDMQTSTFCFWLRYKWFRCGNCISNYSRKVSAGCRKREKEVIS